MIHGVNQFAEMMRRVEVLVKGAFPILSDKHVLDASNFRWTDYGNEVRDDIRGQKEAKLKSKTFAARFIADLSIREKDGKVLDRKPNFVLVILPHITARDSYIVEGNEVQTVNQLRLRPGPYSRFTVDNNTETFINAAGGGYRIIFNRETSVLRLRSGQTYVYLYPVLKLLGMTDGALLEAWGPEILASNKKYDKPDSAVRLYRSMRSYAATIKDPSTMPASELGSSIEEFFNSKALDPAISGLTLREKFDKITTPLLVKASEKAIALARGDAEEDDTESMAFKSVFSVEDFIEERLKKAVPGIQRYVARSMDRTPSITMLMSPMTFSGPVIDWFSTSEFTRYSDQQNPIDMASTAQLTTMMGEGGIQSTFAVSDRVRDVHPSQIGFIDPVHSPEGARVGVTGHLSVGTEKEGTTLKIIVLDAKSGRPVHLSANAIEDSVIAFHDQYTRVADRPKPVAADVKAKDHGIIKMVPAKSVEYVYSDPRSFFSATTNAIPFLYANHSNRALMADRHIEQAVPLLEPEAPLVQSKFDETRGYEEVFGKASNVQSPVDGKIRKVAKDFIEIAGSDRKLHTVSLHDHYPLNGGVFLTDTASVKAGDAVTKGQTIANNNFSKDGSLAIGKNLITALLPYRGWNFEDAVVISEGAAKKLTSEHAHDLRLEITSAVKVGLTRWLAHFPDKAEGLDKSKYDADGIAKKGASFNRGEVVIPAVEEIHAHEEYDYARLHRSLAAPWRNSAVEWESDYPGKVIDVVKSAKFIRVILLTQEQMQVGDKLSTRSGSKGIVSAILPDNEMYRDAKGNVIDMLYNPAGIGGRTIPGLMFEGAAGNIAGATGKKYLVENFNIAEAADDKIRAGLKKAGLSESNTESIYDPVDNRKLDNIYVGNLHVMKLQHQVRKKFSVRGIGGYSVESQPVKISGKHESAQNIGSQEIYALMASGSMHFLRDASTLKSSSNMEYWRALQLGLPLPPPQHPFVLDKFVAQLMSSGINIRQEGKNLKALPVTDKDVKEWSKGEIENASVVRASDLRPEKGGLFDKAVTGGYDGSSWSHVTLESAMPNPLMERPIVSLTGLSSSEFKAIMNGQLFVAKDGELTGDSSKGKSHGEGLKVLLAKVDVNKDLRDTLAKLRTAKGSALNELNKKRRYLQALKALSLTPEKAYIQSVIPVIPPRFRPIYPLPDGSLNVSDANHGYREVILVNNQIKDLKKLGVDDGNLSRMRTDLYKALHGLVGISEPLTRSKDFKGFIATIKGRENKYGFFQGKVVKRPQDLSGRSTVIPDPRLGIDEIAIPEDMALTTYRPFVIRRLVESGLSPTEASDAIDKKTEAALNMLREEVKERPIYMNRAPSLHKFSMLPFRPTITPGLHISVNPLIVAGYGMDFDGDTVGVHVPASEEARVEALRNLPSKQIFAVRDTGLVHLPSKEAILGLYLMTKPEGEPLKASSVQDLLIRFQKNEFESNVPVVVAGKTWTAGQLLINDLFPADSKPGNVVFDKKMMESHLYSVAKKHPKEIGEIISKIKDLGNKYVTRIGFSLGLDDLRIDRPARDKIMREALTKTKTIGFDAAHAEASAKITDLVKSYKGNRAVIGSVSSGAYGKSEGVVQMLGAPVAVTDQKGRTVHVQVPRSYAEGQDITSYWASLPGARRGMVQKGLGTQDSGALAKRLLNTTVSSIISESDCGTTEGLALPTESRDSLDRVIASGPYKGRTVDPSLVRSLIGKGVKTIMVRSPLKCRSVRGICSKCFGLMENGQFPPVGYHIGVLAGQAVSEPATQMMLRQFHTQGVIGQKAVGFARIEQLLEMPDNVKGSAPLSKVTGKVTGVKPSAAGGWFVDIGAAEHFVPKELGLAVKKGDQVTAGQRLSTGGVIKPQELLATTNDIHRVREQLVNDLDQEYKAGNIRIKRNLFETIVKPMTDRAEVQDAGDGEKYGIYRGEIESVNRIEQLNTLIRKAKGRPIRYTPTLLSIGVAPYHNEDFIGKLMFERLHETLIAAPATGEKADVKGGHPITQYTFGRYVVGGKR